MPSIKDPVLDDCRFLVNAGFWSGPRPPTPGPWLQNFPDPKSRHLASSLLRNFQYFSEQVCMQLLKHALLSVQRDVCTQAKDLAERRVAWEKFQRTVLLTYVKGEKPGPVDSGYHYARAARQHLGFRENQIVDPERALEGFIQGQHVVFLDDFVGSGQQFLTTLASARDIRLSFAEAVRDRPRPAIYYCPLISTSYGLKRIQDKEPFPKVLPLFELDDSYQVLSQASRLWPTDAERSAGIAMLRRVAAERNLPLEGFHSLSVAVSFHNSTPDAALQLFFSERGGWQPLVRRS